MLRDFFFLRRAKGVTATDEEDGEDLTVLFFFLFLILDSGLRVPSKSVKKVSPFLTATERKSSSASSVAVAVAVSLVACE